MTEFEKSMAACLEYLRKAEAAIYQGMAFQASCDAKRANDSLNKAIYYVEGVALTAKREADIRQVEAIQKHHNKCDEDWF